MMMNGLLMIMINGEQSMLALKLRVLIPGSVRGCKNLHRHKDGCHQNSRKDTEHWQQKHLFLWVGRQSDPQEGVTCVKVNTDQ
ncbi:hypothetical protein PGT21_004978 [Puccinia graminis f. sp. tritici]|uniref:Uncharacterized protein n=1 Tax=Puccinia graminis f. sp. tritici TaxID=56615 RepID=A0A5B0MDT6_PUCGR|nr:hypothetical protein PGTUg99_031242 [Puccinia graminis f. sp. tritici]KAA1090552.1 hypothetical protein PGT21_004978 [Puccinia graminis f. sp. tritici]